MSSSHPASGPWSSGDAGHGSPDTPEAWQATRAQTALATQIMRAEDDEPAAKRDIGRPIGNNERELFVSCAPPEALQQQFEHINPEFLVVHDIGTTSSRKLLAGIAAASKRSVQKLFIRRQGYGTPLATLEFVELPTADGSPLRMYSTEADADTVSRHGLARTLLGFSRLGVVMVGDLPVHALEAAFRPLRDDILAGPWHNRHLLLLPLAGAAAVSSQGVELGRETRVEVRTTPLVTRPAEAWSFINGTWARIREQMPPPSPAAGAPRGSRFPRVSEEPVVPQRAPAAAPQPAPDHASAPTMPMPLEMRPMPEVPTTKAQAQARVAASGLLDRYVHQLSELTGMVSVCVFELSSGRDVAHAGASPGAADLASHGTELLASITATCRSLGLGHALPDAAITLGAHHLLLRPVPKHPGLALHAVLDKSHANLTLARLQVQRMDSLFDEA
ncbi:MAG: hypothetical protein KF788_23125 [Piscinibacter sp.]|nr:hypothetical protein [Piscinibacter sp.]